MNPRAGLWLALSAVAGCAAIDDTVFEPMRLDHAGEPFVIHENEGRVAVGLRLTQPPREPISARYTLAEVDAQSSCQSPDFHGADGRIEWPAGAQEATISVWVADDDAPELDESFALKLDDFTGIALSPQEIRLMIADDDRTAIVDARTDFGLLEGRSNDQSDALAAALRRARDLGRGVVRVAPGDYEISAIEVPAGTGLSGRGARFHRPAGATNDGVQLAIAYDAASDSERTLIEGLSLDGRRDRQGAYEDDELADSHLIALEATTSRTGRLRAAIESVHLEAGTASGVYVGPQCDVTLCRVRATELFRDAVTLRGGGSALDLRELYATATHGTTGLWFDGQPAGYGGTHRVDVTVEDAVLDSGDLEIEAYGGSRVELTRVEMGRGPLRIQAPDGSVRVTDSVLHTGFPSAVHNFFGLPHDVVLTRTTLLVSPTDPEGGPPPVEPPALVAASVRWRLAPNDALPPLLPAAPPPHAIVFDHCRFERGSVAGRELPEAFAASSDDATGTVRLRAPTLGSGVQALAPECRGCSVEP